MFVASLRQSTDFVLEFGSPTNVILVWAGEPETLVVGRRNIREGVVEKNGSCCKCFVTVRYDECDDDVVISYS